MSPSPLPISKPPARDWLTGAEVLRMPAKSFFVSRLLVEGSFNLLISPRKVGKTLVAVDLGLSVAAGLPTWADHKIATHAQGGLVVYVLGEGVGRFKYRLRAWCETRRLDPAKLHRSFVLYKKALNLLDNEEVDAFINTTIPAMCRRTGKDRPVLIVVDTWSRCVTGAENDEAFNVAVKNIDAIREQTGATVLALHHVPKAGKRTARGSGVLEGAIDAMFALDGEPAKKTFAFELDFSRDLDPGQFKDKIFERRTVQFTETDPETGEFETSAAIVLLDSGEGRERIADDVADAVRDALTTHGPMSRNALASKVGRNKTSVLKTVTAMLQTGELDEMGTGPKAKVAIGSGSNPGN